MGNAKAAEYAGRLKRERGQVFTVGEFYDAFCNSVAHDALDDMLDDMCYVCEDCGVDMNADASASALLMFCEEHDGTGLTSQ